MKRSLKNELFLNYITVIEAIESENFDEYRDMTIRLMKMEQHFFAEKDILNYYQKKTMQQVIEECPDKFFPVDENAPSSDERMWIDIACPVIVSPNTIYYNSYFAYHVGRLWHHSLDEFLDYQLEHHYENDIKKFGRFLELTMRSHPDKISQDRQLTIKEWIEDKSKQPQTPLEQTEAKIKKKGKPTREAGDKRTVLSQEQTALLIHFLKESKIIYREEYLNNKEAGEAFSILTGYSSETMRQTLGEKEIEKIATRKNMNDVINSLTNTITLMDRYLKDKKKS
jgi:hypothetical protein